MLKSIPKVTVTLLIGLLLFPYMSWADIVYEQTNDSEYIVGQGKKVHEVVHQKIYVQDKRVRIEDLETGKVILIQFDRELLFELDTKKLTYTEDDFRSLRILQGQKEMQSKQAAPQRAVGMEAARAQLQKMTEGLPPERKAFMEQMMMRQQSTLQGNGTAGATSDISVKEANETKTINGFSCRRVKVVRGNKKIMDMWLTTEAGPKNYFTHIIETLRLFEPEVTKAVKTIDGFPIKQTYRVQTGPFVGIIQSVEVSKIQETTLSESLFELPKGYTKAGNKAEEVEEEKESF